MRYLTPQRLITLRLGVACFRLRMFRTSYTWKIDMGQVCQTFQTFSHLSLFLFTLFIGPVEVKPVWNNMNTYFRGCWFLTFESRWWSWRFSSWSCPRRWFRSDRSKDILKRCSIGFCFNEDIEEEKNEDYWTLLEKCDIQPNFGWERSQALEVSQLGSMGEVEKKVGEVGTSLVRSLI